MKEFKVGDKVICVKNTPEVQEGWVGYVERVFIKDGDITARQEFSLVTFDFRFDELEVLKARAREHVGIPEVVEIKTQSALDKQVSGNHYKDCGIQPIEYIHANGLDYFEGNAVKYITRHRKKNGKADIEKAIHYLELLLELEYKDESK